MSYLKRLAVSLGVIGVSLLPILIWHGVSVGVILPWFWLVSLHDIFHVLPSFDLHPVVFAFATLLILVLAASRRVASILATGWFVMNAIAALCVLSSLRGFGQGI